MIRLTSRNPRKERRVTVFDQAEVQLVDILEALDYPTIDVFETDEGWWVRSRIRRVYRSADFWRSVSVERLQTHVASKNPNDALLIIMTELEKENTLELHTGRLWWKRTVKFRHARHKILLDSSCDTLYAC